MELYHTGLIKVFIKSVNTCDIIRVFRSNVKEMIQKKLKWCMKCQGLKATEI